MKGQIRIIVEVARHLLRVEVDGFVDMAIVQEYQAARKAAIARLGAPPN